MKEIRTTASLSAFFGRGNYEGKSVITFNPAISDDEIVVLTDDVVTKVDKNNLVQYLMLVDNNKAVYIDYYSQLKKGVLEENGKQKQTYLVKLYRNKFKPYYCTKYEGHHLEKELTFEFLLEDAKQKKKVKVKLQ